MSRVHRLSLAAANAGNWDHKMLESYGRPLAVEFYSPACPECRRQGPAVDAAAAASGPSVLWATVNVDCERALAAAYGVEEVPRVLVFRGGELRGDGGAGPLEAAALLDLVAAN